MVATPDMQRLLDDLQVDIPGALKTTLQSALYRSADEFFDFSNVWREDQDVTLVTNQRAYVLTPPAQGRFVRLLVLYDSQAANEPDLRWVDQAAFTPPTGLLIASTPKAGPVWVARMVKRLATVDADNNPAMPDAFVQQYREALYAGARKYLHALPNMPWTDRQMAVFYGGLFTSEKTKARIDAIKANVVGQTNWVFPTQASRRQRG